MSLLICACCIIFTGAIFALITCKRPKVCTVFGVAAVVLGGIIGLIPSVRVLLTGTSESLRLDWNIPLGVFFIEIDPLSSVFLIPIFFLSALAAVYGIGYLSSQADKKNLGSHWFFYNLLLLGMVLVVVARNGMLFLLAWEVMSLASFFLIVFDHEEKQVRDAGWTYLFATHIGTAFLLVFFIILSSRNGSLDFDKIPVFTGVTANILFLLAIVGFGTKAGFMPLHVWLPEAHPAAPSHVSAVMSGVMIKTGIYGLIRALTFLGPPPAWWCWLLIGIGVGSGVLGVLFALAQHDLKRLLAYHSVENIGIIALGMGVGLLGVSIGSPTLAVLGFAGCLFHVINHAVFKGLLFLGVGAVLHSSGTREIDRLGGLIKLMPWTALTFLVGAIAISGLPPLNGFASEFLIYLGVFRDGMNGGLVTIVSMLAVIGGLALIGGLAAACFTKAFGIVFLGQPRSEYAQHTREVTITMLLPMLILAVCCILLGLFSPLLVSSAGAVIGQVTLLPQDVIHGQLDANSRILKKVVIVSAILLGMIGILALLRKWLLSGRTVEQTVTWDCGYARPTARMQYTASSFAQPMAALFNFFLRIRSKFSPPKGIFPDQVFLHTDMPDMSREYIYEPMFERISLMLAKFKWIQHGRLQIYVLYIALTLWMLLIWKIK
jgi:hydrogenase-4 component B